MRTDLFDFELPEERIALHPVSPRDAARLLVVPAGEAPFADRGVRDLPALLRAGDALVFNDTRVIPAALEGVRRRGDLECQRRGDADRAARRQPLARAGAAGQAPAGGRPAALRPRRQHVPCGCARCHRVGDAATTARWSIAFDLSGPDLDAAIAAVGRDAAAAVHRRHAAASRTADRADYQTIYAAHDGAVAAPTAGLHFTPELMAALEARGISRHFVTLHVGAGTFLPVKADDTADHKMHFESGRDFRRDGGGAQCRARARRAHRRRRHHVAAPVGDRRPRRASYSPSAARPTSSSRPATRFRAVDILMTNFHLPRSTLFMLVAAFAGLERMQAAYAHAIAAGYRFYSYGDASLLFPGPQRVSVIPAELERGRSRARDPGVSLPGHGSRGRSPGMSRLSCRGHAEVACAAHALPSRLRAG